MAKLLKACSKSFEHISTALSTAVDLASMLTSLKIDEENTSVKDWRRYEELTIALEGLASESIQQVIDWFASMAELTRAAEGVSFLENPDIEFPELARLMEAAESNEPVVDEPDEPDVDTAIEIARRYQDDSDEIVEESDETESETVEEDEQETVEEDPELPEIEDSFCSDMNTVFEKIRAAREEKHVEPALDTPEGYRAIDWLKGSGIPRDKYMINRSRSVVDRYKGVTIRTRRKNGKEVYELTGTVRKNGKRKAPRLFIDPDVLYSTAFPEYSDIHVSRTGRVDIEAVSRPVDLSALTQPVVTTIDDTPVATIAEAAASAEPVETEVKITSDWVDIDWIDEIPAGKYSVHKNGIVRNNETNETIIPKARMLNGGIKTRLCEFIPGDGKRGVYRRLGVIVWQAFNPEDRGKPVRIRFIDGDGCNCELSNITRRG